MRTMLWFSVLAYIPMSATYFLRSDPRKSRLQDFVLDRRKYFPAFVGDSSSVAPREEKRREREAGHENTVRTVVRHNI